MKEGRKNGDREKRRKGEKERRGIKEQVKEMEGKEKKMRR